MNVNLSSGTNTTVKLNLEHSVLPMGVSEVRFDLHQTISSVKDSCEKRFGTSAGNMQLVLKDTHNNSVATMNEDDRTLGFYSPQDFYTIYVIDLDPNSIVRELGDLSQVEKYMMSDEDYDKLPDSFRKWRAHLAARNGEVQPPKVEKDAAYMAGEASSFVVGNRCKLTELSHRGVIKYVGMIPELAEGWFIGIQLDEPFGKNDGTVKGVKYFDCFPKYGMIVRPDKVIMGDFPELDMDEDDDEI